MHTTGVFGYAGQALGNHQVFFLCIVSDTHDEMFVMALMDHIDRNSQSNPIELFKPFYNFRGLEQLLINNNHLP